MRRIVVLSLLIIMVLTGCNKEDDLSQIFSGTFKITSYRYNHQYDNEKIRELNQNLDLYCITFTGNTFALILNADTRVSGTWYADAESREMRMTLDTDVQTTSELARMIKNIIKNASSYKGDHNVVRIYESSSNFIDIDSGVK